MAEVEKNELSKVERNRWSGSETVLFTLIPMAGSISYEIFSANITNPKQFIKLFTPYELKVASGLWLNSHLGVGLFIYSRRHIERAAVVYRILYSTMGSVLFNFGSFLLWATLKSVLPPDPRVRVGIGGASGLLLLFLGYSYFTFVDSIVACRQAHPLPGVELVGSEEEVD